MKYLQKNWLGLAALCILCAPAVLGQTVAYTAQSLATLPAASKAASEKLPAYDYKAQADSLQAAIAKHFYLPATGYYKERADSSQHDRPASYLWPLCGLIQADNEMEVIGYPNRMRSTLRVIDKYYDDRSPAPGYASYPPPLGGGDRFYDDNQWIGIAAADAYFRTGNRVYWEKSQLIYRFMMTAYDTVTGGGLYWEEGKLTTKNTCSNGPGIILALQLYKASHKKAFLDTALLLYKWVNAHLRDSAGLYYDNIGIPSRHLDQRRYSYNTGTMLQSAAYLYELTKDKKYLQEAKTIAKASLDHFYGRGQLRDGFWFNAVLLRAYQHLYTFDKDPVYLLAFRTCIDHALQHNKDSRGLFTGNNGKAVDLTNQAGMLEILARLARLEEQGVLH